MMKSSSSFSLTLLWLCLPLLCRELSPLCAQEDRQEDRELVTKSAETSSANKTDSSTTLVVVVGAGGEPQYLEQFAKWAEQWQQLAQRQTWNLISIGVSEKPSPVAEGKSPNEETPQIADAEKLQAAIAALESKPSGDALSAPVAKRLWLVLIGHGTATGKVAKLNLTGPDVTSAQLKSWLDKTSCETVIVDCTSSSAPFLVELSAKNRVVVTATRSSGEVNFSRFGQYMAEAIGNVAADLDHDSEVSLLEAFLKASKETERFYLDNARLATEHALLDDNADRTGTPANFYVGSTASTVASGGKSIDGKKAARIVLWSSPGALRLTAAQIASREQIETEIDLLRDRKKNLAEEAFYKQLEELLVKLAAIYDEAEQGK